jgi:hypothetical protein
MTTKHKTTSRILEAVHDTARGLYEAGFIDSHRMGEYDALNSELNPGIPNEDSSLHQIDSRQSFEVGHE